MRYETLTIEDLYTGLSSNPETDKPGKHKITDASGLRFDEEGMIALSRGTTITTITGDAHDYQRTSVYHNGYLYTLFTNLGSAKLHRASGLGAFSLRYTFGASAEAVYLCAFKNRIIAWWYDDALAALKLSYSTDEGATFTKVAWSFDYVMDHIITEDSIYVLTQDNKIYVSTDGSTFTLYKDLTTTHYYAREIEYLDGMIYVTGTIRSSIASIPREIFIGRFESNVFKIKKRMAGQSSSMATNPTDSKLIIGIYDGNNIVSVWTVSINEKTTNRDIFLKKIGNIPGSEIIILGSDDRITYIQITDTAGAVSQIYEMNVGDGIYYSRISYPTDDNEQGVLIATISGQTILMTSSFGFIYRYTFSITAKLDEGILDIDFGDLGEHVPIGVRIVFEPGLAGTAIGLPTSSPELQAYIYYDTQILTGTSWTINIENYKRALRLIGDDTEAQQESIKYRSCFLPITAAAGQRLAVTGAGLQLLFYPDITGTKTAQIKKVEYMYLPIGMRTAK